MAIILYLKDLKTQLVLKETADGFREALEAGHKARSRGEVAAVSEFDGFHGHEIWVGDLFGNMLYAVYEKDKIIKDRMDLQEKEMKQRQARGDGKLVTPSFAFPKGSNRK